MLVRELFRYRKGRRTRAYGLKMLSSERSELWVHTEDERGQRRGRRLVTFESTEDEQAFLEDVRYQLRAGGWVESGG
jgi:hypothetical protein